MNVQEKLQSIWKTTKEYLDSRNSTNLINYIEQYVEPITEHLDKENNGLFMMAKARLQYVSGKVDKELNNIEESNFKKLKKLENIMKN